MGLVSSWGCFIFIGMLRRLGISGCLEGLGSIGGAVAAPSILEFPKSASRALRGMSNARVETRNPNLNVDPDPATALLSRQTPKRLL